MDALLTTAINKTHYCVPPLGLGYLVSALRKSNLSSVEILDSGRGLVNYDKFSEYLRQKKPKVLGIQCYSFDVCIVNRMLKIAKDINPGIVTIIGGPHPTAVPESVFSDFNNLDFAIRGEGEISFPLFMMYILSNDRKSLVNVPGLIYRSGDRTVVNEQSTIKDLDFWDIPSWDSMDPRRYSEQVQGAFYKGLPVAPIITSRGCPYECTFCSNKILMGRVLRFRDIEKVVSEIQLLSTTYGVKEIQILDDNFSMNKKRVLRFCEEIKKRRIEIHIAFPNGLRLDSLDKEILLALKDIGAYLITVGIESGSQRVLDHMKKALKLDMIKEKVKLIKNIGLKVNAFFIVGYPAETKEDIEKTIRFARTLPLDIAHFSCFLPLPGTEITQELLKSGKLKRINYEELFYSKVPYSPEGITKKELKALQRKAFLCFFLRPRIFISLILRLRSFNHLKSILKRTRDYIFSKG